MIDRLDHVLVRVNQAILIALLAAMSVIVFANVMLRFLTDVSIVWAEEAARYMMIWLTFLGMGLVYRYGGHLAVDNLQDALAPRFARALRVLILLLVAGFGLLMMWIGANHVDRTWVQTTPVLQLPFGLVYTAMPLGAALLILHVLAVARRFVGERRFDGTEGFDPSAGAGL